MVTNHTESDFCISIDFEKGSEDPTRVFRVMTDLIDSFQTIDSNLIQSLGTKIDTVLLLEDIESGSIKAWLRNRLQLVGDDNLKALEWKPIVGGYLVEAKYYILKFLDENKEISNRNQIQELGKGIHKLAEKTDIVQLPAYTPIPAPKIVHGIERITSSLTNLTEHDKALYISSKREVPFNTEFKVVTESIEDLLTKESIKTSMEILLKVKKPDYLGESMWEFKHDGRSIPAKILDKKWLEDFQARNIDIRPMDAIRAKVECFARIGFDGEIIANDYKIIEVLEVIKMDNKQGDLGLPE